MFLTTIMTFKTCELVFKLIIIRVSFHSIYINIFAGEVKIKMTRGVTTSHSLVKRDRVWGDVEEQEMCFYLEKKFQADGTEPVPEPEDEAVYIVNRPRFVVFARKFPG